MHDDPVARLRRFQRAVTFEIGVPEASFRGRGGPPGAARVLDAVARGQSDVAAIREDLGMDSRRMSRLLRRLEREGLIQMAPDGNDARHRRVTLSNAGKHEVRACEALADARARDLLDRHGQGQALLEAMDLIATIFGRDRIALRQVDPRDPAATACLRRYYDELARRLEQGFDVSLSCDPEAEAMMPPRGVFLVALSDGMAVGCAGLKGHAGGEAAEVKRVWVAPAARGLGLARRLMAAIEDQARAQGIARLLLDTNSALPEAVALYQRLGWTRIARFNDDPYPDVFFEKRLFG